MSIVKPMRPAMKPMPALMLSFLCGVLGVGFLYWTCSQVRYIYISSNWPHTQGRILESKYIDRGPRKDGEPRIRYKYEVNGQSYESNHLLPGTLAYVDAVEEEKIQYYRPGLMTNVYYDPQNPQDSSLEPATATRLTYIGVILGLCFVAGAGYILVNVVYGKPVRL